MSIRHDTWPEHRMLTTSMFFVSEECSSAEEAAAIAKHFRDVAAAIRGQIERQ